jgi:hypothetical protein
MHQLLNVEKIQPSRRILPTNAAFTKYSMRKNSPYLWYGSAYHLLGEY